MTAKNEVEKTIQIEQLAEIIGGGIHASLRKYTVSKEANAAYQAISEMPDDEWNDVCRIVAKEILKFLNNSV